MARTTTSMIGTMILLEQSFKLGLTRLRWGLMGVQAATNAHTMACTSIIPICADSQLGQHAKQHSQQTITVIFSMA